MLTSSLSLILGLSGFSRSQKLRQVFLVGIRSVIGAEPCSDPFEDDVAVIHSAAATPEITCISHVRDRSHVSMKRLSARIPRIAGGARSTVEVTSRTVEEVRSGNSKEGAHRCKKTSISFVILLSQPLQCPTLTLPQQLILVIVAALAITSVTPACAKYEIFLRCMSRH
jgi:hypothetical protein